MRAKNGGTNMLVTNLLLGIIIVVLFAILDRLGDMYYADEPESMAQRKGVIACITSIGQGNMYG